MRLELYRLVELLEERLKEPPIRPPDTAKAGSTGGPQKKRLANRQKTATDRLNMAVSRCRKRFDRMLVWSLSGSGRVKRNLGVVSRGGGAAMGKFRFAARLRLLNGDVLRAKP